MAASATAVTSAAFSTKYPPRSDASLLRRSKPAPPSSFTAAGHAAPGLGRISAATPVFFRPVLKRLLQTRSPSWIPKVKSGEAEGHPSTEGLILDEQTLQHDLEIAIKEEDYALAAKLRDNLRLLQEDSKTSVLAANSKFYHAFRNGDLAAMQSIWAKGDNVYVVHPGASRISGYELVIGSWEFVLGADYEFPIQIELKDVEVHVRGDFGYITCLEVVKTKGSSWGKQIATNVFERVDGQWYMCIHHASHFDM
ncbi:uncharacterized protein LOC109826143 [Asparagus officinalis]|uniref:uncharacterized protein LOC109826143 n=1 Tax=Asparagus officinalis TaxID=4686 RepID=UPI00098E78E9|nr:uncharacterized protein LOC109826143 [Asparagus officinalis]